MTGKRKRGSETPGDESDSGDEFQKWNIKYLPSGADGVVQKSPFQTKGQPEGSLDFIYVVEPKHKWDNMQRYNNFIIAGEQYSRGEYVWVTAPAKDFVVDDVFGDNPKFWVGKILEVRAKDRSNVYAKIAWLYWPQDLPRTRDQGVTEAGRRSYHGKHELVASNCIDIQDVTTFCGKAPVKQWSEDDDEDEQTGFYWRQTLDIRGDRLSELKKVCVCRRYQNPDKKLYGCSGDHCRRWLHEECLLDDILNKTYNRLLSNETSSGGNVEGHRITPKSKKAHKKGGKPAPKLYEGLFAATIIDGDGPTQVEIHDLRPDAEIKSWKEGVNCPNCQTTID